MIIGLHHAQVTISKREEEGKKFYCRILGLPEKKIKSLKGRRGFS